MAHASPTSLWIDYMAHQNKTSDSYLGNNNMLHKVTFLQIREQTFTLPFQHSQSQLSNTMVSHLKQKQQGGHQSIGQNHQGCLCQHFV